MAAYKKKKRDAWSNESAKRCDRRQEKGTVFDSDGNDRFREAVNFMTTPTDFSKPVGALSIINRLRFPKKRTYLRTYFQSHKPS